MLDTRLLISDDDETSAYIKLIRPDISFDNVRVTQEQLKKLFFAVTIELIVSVLGRVFNILSLFDTIIVWTAFAVITTFMILVPEIPRRILQAIEVLLGKQPDKNLRKLGVHCGVESSRGSRFSPESCIERTDQELYFMGMLGSKWVEKPEPYNSFKNMLEEIKQDGTEVRFLLADWKSEGYDRILERRNRENLSLIKIADHYRDYLKLANEYDCLEVRLYSQIPTFRMVFIDNEELGISKYRYQPPSDEFNRGRNIPHMVVNKEAKFSLYDTFVWTYEEIWTDSVEIEPDHIPHEEVEY